MPTLQMRTQRVQATELSRWQSQDSKASAAPIS